MRHSSAAALALLLVIGRIHTLFGEESTSIMTDVSFVANCDGTEQKYVVLLPASFKISDSHDVLIALHGHGSDRWQFVKQQRGECRVARDVAAKHSLIYVSPDYRAKTSWMGPKAEADVVQIIAELKQKYRVSRVFLCGASMGGTASLTFAVLHPKLIDGVASMNGTANFVDYEKFQDAIAKSFGGTKGQVPLEYKKRSAEYWPRKLAMPIGLAVSRKDTIVPPQSVLRLAKKLKELGHESLKLIHADRGHSTTYEDAMTILEFIIERAGKTGEKETVQQPGRTRLR